MMASINLTGYPARTYPLLKKPGSLLERIKSEILHFVALKK
jgi:hypothetical protein